MAKSPLKTISDRVASAFSAQARAMAECRRDMDELDADVIAARNRLAAVRAAPVSLDELEERIDSFLLEQEADARTNFSGDILSAPNGSVSASNICVALSKSTSSIGALAILGFRETIRENLIREALEASKGEPITATDREREIRRLEEEIAELEKVREKYAREAEKHGITIPRSEYADPAALLMPDED